MLTKKKAHLRVVTAHDSGNGFVVKDSGERRDFATGARRDMQTGKGRFDLMPTLPQRRVAQLYEAGAIKYGDNNWQKGMPLRVYLDSADRHLNLLKSGEPTEDHAAAVVWNMFSYMWTLDAIEQGLLPKDLDNRTPEPQYRVIQMSDRRKTSRRTAARRKNR